MSELFTSDSSALPDFRSTVLRQLAEAAGNGLALTKLVSKKPQERTEQERVVRGLEEEGAIKSLRKGHATRYWLAEHLPPQIDPGEQAEEVLRRVLPEQPGDKLLTVAKIRDELLKGLGIKDGVIFQCLGVLEEEGLVVKLTEGARTLYAYAPALRALLGEEEEAEEQEMEEEPAEIVQAAVASPPARMAEYPSMPTTPVVKQISARELAGLKPVRRDGG